MYREDGVRDSTVSRYDLLLSQVGTRSDVIKSAAARGIPAQASSLSCTPYLQKLRTTHYLVHLLSVHDDQSSEAEICVQRGKCRKKLDAL